MVGSVVVVVRVFPGVVMEELGEGFGQVLEEWVYAYVFVISSDCCKPYFTLIET